MTHNLGRLILDGRTFDQSTGLNLTPAAGARFLILHIDSINLSGGAQVTVDLGYGTDVFSAGAGDNFWTRPIDVAAVNPVPLRISGGNGSGVLA